MRKYFYSLIARYIGLYARPGDTLVEIDAITKDLSEQLTSEVTHIRLHELLQDEPPNPTSTNDSMKSITADTPC